MRSIILIILCFFWSAILYGQSTNYKTINFTIDDGLPSNECHDVIQDSLGYIWIATDRGLSRFDGYSFKNYGIQEGLTDLSCLELYLDHNQTIWIRTFSKRIFQYQPKLDSIIPYKYNNRIKAVDSGLSFIDKIVVDTNKVVYIALHGHGLLSIRPNGETNYIKSKGDDIKFEVIDINKEKLPISYYRKNLKDKLATTKTKTRTKFDYHLSYGQNIYNLKIAEKDFNFSSARRGAYALHDDQFLFLYKDVLFYFENEDLVGHRAYNEITDVVKFDHKGILVACSNKGGLLYFKNVKDIIHRDPERLILDNSLSSILVDNENGIWSSSLDNGIFYLKDVQINTLPSVFLNGKKIYSIDSDDKGSIYLNVDKNILVRYDIELNEEIQIDSFTQLNDLLVRRSNKQLVVTTNNGCYYIDITTNEARTVNQLDEYGYDPMISNNILSLDNELLVFINSNGYYIYNKLNSIAEYYSGISNIGTRVKSIASINDTTFLVGTVIGLYKDINNKFIPIRDRDSLFSARINSIQKNNNKYYIGTQGEGLLIYDLENNPLQINKSDGLVSNTVENVFVDSNDAIFVSTFSGLSRITFIADTVFVVKNFNIFHGLPSNEVFDITEFDNKYYVATGKGIGVISSDIYNTNNYSPIIEKIQVGNEVFKFEKGEYIFPYNKNSIDINYKTIAMSMQGDILYRFSLDEQPWKETKATFVNFAYLNNGIHSFKIESKNADGIWGKATEFKFTIKPPWWKTTWFYIMSLIAICLVIYTIFSYREYQFRNQELIKEEIRELEKSALQAQMNPHFIFNCLNSIQNFIMNNDKEQAMSYLSHFAKLIRHNLNASNESLIPLDQEIAMLKNYLLLEKLRFKDSFNYQININPNINSITTSIPPLLIQPYVENAVIHGMHDKKEGGLIKVDFARQNGNLVVVVEDNGPGYTSKVSSSTHKSLGISITNKRLAYINNIQSEHYKIVPLSSEHGTKVTILIKAELES